MVALDDEVAECRLLLLILLLEGYAWTSMRENVKARK